MNTNARGGKKAHFKIFILIVIVIAVLAGGYFWRSIANIVMNKAPAGGPAVVNFAKSSTQMWAEEIHGVGTVISDHEIKLTAQAAGLIDKVYVQQGQQVKKGQQLYALYSGAQTAALQQAEAELKINKDKYDRDMQLYKSRGIASSELFQNKQLYLQSLAAVTKARTELQFTQITAPSDGVIGLVNIRAGNYVAVGQVLNAIITSKDRQVSFFLPASRAQLIKIDDAVTYKTSLDDAKPIANGKIVAINIVADPNDHMQMLKASINKTMTPGSYVTVVVDVGQKKATVVVPTSAVDRSIYGNSVFKVVAGKAVPTSVQLGEQRGAVVAVKNLASNVTVVNGGLNKLMPNAPVTNKNALN